MGSSGDAPASPMSSATGASGRCSPILSAVLSTAVVQPWIVLVLPARANQSRKTSGARPTVNAEVSVGNATTVDTAFPCHG
ncbi:hypothetical protein [Actinopolyspora mortivallis]|uniref:hypothetical protein n=1 Tax=Actinopolyspora mortivallis TaxID=33906 RepID=UPI0012EDC1C7|nr:hypothetical protein [Actinopolyspora mortivallis]